MVEEEEEVDGSFLPLRQQQVVFTDRPKKGFKKKGGGGDRQRSMDLHSLRGGKCPVSSSVRVCIRHGPPPEIEMTS